MGHRVELKITLATWWRRGSAPTGERPQPGHELGEEKRFDQIVVPTGSEPGNPVRPGIAGGQKQHRGRHTVRLQCPAEITAVGIRKADVDDQQIGRLRGCHPHGPGPVGGRPDPETCFGQPVLKQPAQVAVILHHQDGRIRHDGE